MISKKKSVAPLAVANKIMKIDVGKELAAGRKYPNLENLFRYFFAGKNYAFFMNVLPKLELGEGSVLVLFHQQDCQNELLSIRKQNIKVKKRAFIKTGWFFAMSLLKDSMYT